MNTEATDPLAVARAPGFRAALRAFAREHLPGAMVPGRIVVGDRSLDGLTGTAYAAPTGPVEARLVGIWQDVLGVHRVGVADDFFDLGGNSLTATHLLARVREECGVEVGLHDLYARPVIAELARLVGDETVASDLSRGIDPDALAAEALLPDDVRPERAAEPVASFRNVVLTGATGFVGAFLLREVLDRSDADVHVLVRAGDRDGAVNRVRKNLAAYGLWRRADARRLVGVPADLSRPYLGLGRPAFEELARQADLVLHSGAGTSAVLPYQQLKTTNVLGTLEVLRLAFRGRVKPVHYVSSLEAFPDARGARLFDEAELSSADDVIGGRAQTKWVADRFVAQAGRRGLPVAIHRPGQVVGARAAGACPPELFLCAWLKGCIQLGSAPDLNLLVDAVPVDFVAASIAHIALSGTGLGQAHHLPGAPPVRWAEIVDLLADSGYRVSRKPYEEWRRDLRAAVEAGAENALIPFLPLLGAEGPAPDLPLRNGGHQFETGRAGGSELAPPADVSELISGCLDYLIAIGHVEPPMVAE
ncbi:thioester reductase domain-containing protein [Saccharopolyspora sp. NPDC050389]|uniref:thioester reductase domain-containing protein n=1 Tax=Saccharopolyspora sp. NPDC050389 TaxID=3155516 RepID=UPI00340FC5A4